MSVTWLFFCFPYSEIFASSLKGGFHIIASIVLVNSRSWFIHIAFLTTLFSSYYIYFFIYHILWSIHIFNLTTSKSHAPAVPRKYYLELLHGYLNAEYLNSRYHEKYHVVEFDITCAGEWL